MDGIQSENQIVVTAKTNVIMNHAMRTSFQVAVDHLSELIGSTFSNTSYQGQRPVRNVLQMETGQGGRGSGSGGRMGQCGCGRGCDGRGANSSTHHNGVDISDKMHSFLDEEWRKLSPKVIYKIRQARGEHHKAEREARKQNVATVIAEPVEDQAMPQTDQEDGPFSNGSGFGSGAYSNKRRAPPNCQQSWLPMRQESIWLIYAV
jgi:hypothetical protein